LDAVVQQVEETPGHSPLQGHKICNLCGVVGLRRAVITAAETNEKKRRAMHAMNATAWPYHYREVYFSTASAALPPSLALPPLYI
jgi:hypothetical protein